MRSNEQLLLPDERRTMGCSLPTAYSPVAPSSFSVEKIVLCRGSLDTPEREAFVRCACSAYPNVPVEERLATPHNRVDMPGATPTERIARGKRTLVFGELGLASAVWENELRSRVFPEEMCFSVYGFCPFDCVYCYLAATPGVWHSPTIKVYVNLPEIVDTIARKANALGRSTTFYLGRYQDGVALDPLTAYSTVLVPFFAEHRHARQVIQTKSTEVDRLLELHHKGKTALSWTLTPPEIAGRYEPSAPPVRERIEAMQRCAEKGYPVRASIAPVIPDEGWQTLYPRFVREVLERVPLERLIVSGVCMDVRSLETLEHRLGPNNPISRNLERKPADECERVFYREKLCLEVFRRIRRVAQDFGCTGVVSDTGYGSTMALEFGREARDARSRCAGGD